MGEPFPGTPPSVRTPEDPLDSWKEIAAYLKRDVTTVQRWEKREGMPVHRHQHDRMGSVYAFSSELDAWVQSRKLRLAEEEKERTAETPADGETDHRSKWTPWPRRWLVLAAVAVIALVGVTYFWIRNQARGAARPKITSLAVLPLKNLSGDPAQEYLADGMTEALIGRLSNIHDLRVISRTSAMQFKGTQLTVPEIARTLRVDALVEGSVIREGSRIRVTAQLIRGVTDDHFWSETYDRDLKDALTLESDVAQSIAHKVEVTVTGEERARLVAERHVAPEVYESYLKAQFIQSYKRSEVERKIAYLQDAINRDSRFAPAYLGLANAYGDLSDTFVGGPTDEVRPKAMSAARKALELDPQLAEAHDLLADLQQDQWNWVEAETEYKRALDLNPNDAEAHKGLANWLLCQGHIEEALTWAQRARELDPLGMSGVQTGWILFSAHRYDEAIRELRSVLAVRPDYDYALWALGVALTGNRQYEAAIPVLEKTVAIMERSPSTIESLATAYAYAGRRTEALRLIYELKQRRQTGYVSAVTLIEPYLALGDRDEAFVWFERAYQEKSGGLQYMKVDPFLDPVRNDPRFADLLHRVGLDQAR
jgi:TolB-like protein/Tfp pilus assembly protein PilF